MFLAQQKAPFVQPVADCPCDQYGPTQYAPTIRYQGPVPHGRSGDQWGPDQYGYTDFDDYRLAIHGA